MEDVERLLKATVDELDRLLSAKNALGTPIEKDGVTIVPMLSYGFRVRCWRRHRSAKGLGRRHRMRWRSEADRGDRYR